MSAELKALYRLCIAWFVAASLYACADQSSGPDRSGATDQTVITGPEDPVDPAPEPNTTPAISPTDTDFPPPEPDPDSGSASPLVAVAVSQLGALSSQPTVDLPVEYQDIQSATEGASTPPVFSYPRDFPVTRSSNFLHTAIVISDLRPRTVYRFAVNAGSTPQQQAIFVFNVSDDNETVSVVCMDFEECTGTAATGRVLLALVATQSAGVLQSFTVEETTMRAFYNEGTPTEPVLLTAALPLYFSGAVGPMMPTSTELIAGESHYRIDGLEVGHRYLIALQNLALADARVDFTTPVDLKCDPNFSTDYSCQFVAGSAVAQFSVNGQAAIYGDAYDIVVEHLANPDQFDGSWHQPMVLGVTDGSLHHLANIDHNAASYYLIENQYTDALLRITATGKTDGARLSRFDPEDGTGVYSPGCSSIDDSTADEQCVVKDQNPGYFWIRGSAMTTPPSTLNRDGVSSLWLSAWPGVVDVGDTDNPLAVQLAGVTRLATGLFERSVYRLESLLPGTALLVSASGRSNVIDVRPFLDAGDSIVCDESGFGYCIFTPPSDSVLLELTRTSGDTGQPVLLTVGAVPENQTRTLDATELPFTAQVGSFYSNYTITGLVPEEYYLVEANNISTRVQLAAWPASENTISCMVETESGPAAGCLVADAGGEINVRVNSQYRDAGAYFDLDVVPALPLNVDYQSIDTPIRVPDNDPAGVRSALQIENQSSTQIDSMAITVLLDHGYSSDLVINLIAPDGRTVKLVDHLSGSLNLQTGYSDWSSLKNTTTDAFQYRTVVRPLEPLHPLYDGSPNGVWQLQLIDDRDTNISSAQGGRLLGWGISFTD